MKTNTIIASVIVLIIAAMVYNFIRIDRLEESAHDQQCRSDSERCTNQCEHTRDTSFAGIQLERTRVQFQLNLDLLQCMADNLGNQQAIKECRDEKTKEAFRQFAIIDAKRNAILDAYQQCREECKRIYHECIGEDDPDIAAVAGTGFELDCLDPPCFRKVDEICTLISGVCKNCEFNLCGDSQWTFTSDRPLAVSLEAADTLKNRRVIAASLLKAEKAVLHIPKNIQLTTGEKLYFNFNPEEHRAGKIRVTVYRQ